MDIVAGLKNAVERGYSMEQAKQTLINSGYNVQEIQQAVNYLTGGLTTTQPQKNVQPQKPQQQPKTTQQLQTTQQPQATQQPLKQKKKFPLLLVFLIFLLLILVSAVILSIIFKDNLIILFQDLF